MCEPAAPAPAAASVAVVVVTYGDRLPLVEPTLAASLGERDVAAVVVVDNGADGRVSVRLAAMAEADPRLTVVRLEENRGSAGGFRAGLEAAARSGARFVWLLDDDTCPEPGAAEALVERWNRLRPGAEPTVRALLSQRWDEARYRRENAWSANAAFGVDLAQRVRQRVRGADATIGGPILLRMSPWSGLFFERQLIELVGLPDERLIVYEDDHDFTLRVTAGGGRILLVPGSRLVTLAPSWHEKPSGRAVSPWLSASDPWRVYYAARNRVYVERRHLVTRPLRHGLNLAAFVARVALSGFGATHRQNTRWFLAGIADGWRGHLGCRRFPAQEKSPSPFSA